MDSTTSSLIVTQAITFVLLIISEILPLSNSPYSGILQALKSVLEEKEKTLLNEKEKEKPNS